MRIVLNTLILLMLAVLAGGGAMHWKTSRIEQAQLDLARAELMRFQREINVRSAMRSESSSTRGYPLEIDLAWFESGLPLNPLLGSSHPWLEIAHEEEWDLFHPPDRVATDPHLARFWYNPEKGMVRARVPATVSDATALRMYNFINGVALTDLIADEEPEKPDPPVRGRR